MNKFSFKIRPGYGSENLLIEFGTGSGSNEMIKELLKALERIDATLATSEDVWMNDETWLFMESIGGEFLITIHIWNLVFILADENQKVIPMIEQSLVDSGLFIKEDAIPMSEQLCRP